MANIKRSAEAIWQGDLQTGKGQIKLGSKAYEGPYSFKERTSQSSSATNPEELIGAALAGCYSMQLSALLSKAGQPPEKIDSVANVIFELNPAGPFISLIELETKAKVPGMTQAEFDQHAQTAKTICPISKALQAVKIELKATLTD